MVIWQYGLLYIAVLIGGALAFQFKKDSQRLLKRVLSFVGAYLLGILVLHLIPHAYEGQSQTIGLWVLAGFFIQLALEQFSLGVEHGHIHDHHHNNRPMFALQVMLSLSIHAFMEGMPLSHVHEHTTGIVAHDTLKQNYLFIGVIMHKAPEAFALALLLLMSHFSKKIVWFCILVFAGMSPLGAWLMQIMHFSEQTFQIVLAIVIGSLLHISTTILFEVDNTDEHRISILKIGAILAGLSLSVLSIF
jgi:zinc transporter ZupT